MLFCCDFGMSGETCGGNLWAGANVIPGGPRIQNKNGKLFEELLNRNPNLSVVNKLPQCKGLIYWTFL